MVGKADGDQSSQSDKVIPMQPQERPRDAKSQLSEFLKSRIDHVQLHYHDFLAELTFLQGGGLMNEYDSWRRQPTQELMQALCSGHLDAEDLNKISDLMSGHLTVHQMFPVDADSTQNDNAEDSDEDIDVSLTSSKDYLICEMQSTFLLRRHFFCRALSMKPLSH